MMEKDIKNPNGFQELNEDELEEVAGGGIKEIVAATTLAAMAMTGNTVSAFTMARAMAEETTGHIEAAPEQEAFGAEFEGEMTDTIEPEAETVEAGPVEALEGPVEEADFDLDDEEEAVAEPEEETAFVAEAEAPADTTFEVGTQKVFKLDALATACGIEGVVTDVGATNDDYVVNFVVFTDEDGDPAIEFTRSFDAMELAFITADDVQTALLTNAVIAEEAEITEDESAEITGEAVEADAAAITEEGGEAEEPVDRTQLLNDMIDTAVEARKTEGIYAALDNTFSIVAENVNVLANPETGEIEIGSGDIASMAFDALSANFDQDPDLLMGAIGAAALRAEHSGLLPVMASDQALVSLAASENETKKREAQSQKIAKSYFDGTLDTLGAFSEFRPVIVMLKFLGDRMFGALDESENPNAAVLARLDELEAQIKKSEQNLRDHTYNVIQMQSLGDKFNTVADKAATIRTYIGDIERDDRLDADQKIQEIAALYKDSEFKSLVSAMNGATRCFTSRENDIFENQNVFEAAYRRACEEVMFSREAIDMTMPYLTRQLNTYLGAYATMAQVYDAYEAVYGAGSLKQSREEISLRVAGCDLNGNKVQKSIPELFADYFNSDKFIFVGKSNNTNIKLSPKILFVKDFAKRFTKEEMRWNKRDMPDFMKKNPLSYDHVKALAEYCKEKKMQIAQLINAMGFEGELNGDNNEFGSALNLYLAAGAQSIFDVNDKGSATSSYTEIEIRCDAVQACQVNTSVKKLTLRKVCSGGGSYSNNHATVHMMVFQPR